MHQDQNALMGVAGCKPHEPHEPHELQEANEALAPAVPEGNAQAAEAVIDLQVLARLGELDPGGRQGLVQRILQTYETSLVRQLQDLAQAREGVDVPQLGRIAHTLKSSSAAIGATGLAQDCAAIEQGARVDGRMPDAAVLDALLARAQAVRSAVAAMLAA